MGGIRSWLEGQLGEGDPVPTHRTRLLSTLLAVNLFFFFKSNIFWFAGTPGEHLVEFLVAAITAAWLWRGWWREEDTYRRESTSESLRRQLAKLPNLGQVLDNRRLEDLSALEIFTLAKAIPTLGLHQARDIYRGVMEDLLEAAARESVHELMQVAGMEILDPDTLSGAQRERLEHIRLSSGVNPTEWETVQKGLGPESPRRLELLRTARLEPPEDPTRAPASLAEALDLLATDWALCSAVRPLCWCRATSRFPWGKARSSGRWA